MLVAFASELSAFAPNARNEVPCTLKSQASKSGRLLSVVDWSVRLIGIQFLPRGL